MSEIIKVGGARGTVFLSDFDEAIVRATGAELFEVRKTSSGASQKDWFIAIPGVDPATEGEPGVRVIFAFPEDTSQEFAYPCVVVRRGEFSPAMDRYHPGSESYRLPAPGHVVFPLSDGSCGVDRVETKPSGLPYDFNYDLEIQARYRDNMRNPANKILQWVMKRVQPFFSLVVQDSAGDLRPYSAWAGTVAPLDKVPGIKDRRIGFTIPVRVEGELDLNDPVIAPTVRGRTLTLGPA